MARNNEVEVTFKALTKEFNDNIKKLTGENAKMRKEFKLEEEQMKRTGSETDKLEHKVKRLGNEKENTRKKIELTEKQLEKAKDLYGENSTQAEKLSNELLGLQVSEQKIENAISDASDKVTAQKRAMGEGLTQAEKYQKSLKEVGESATKMGDDLQKQGKKISDFGKSYSTKVTLPIVASGAAAFKLASDFESAFAGVEKTVEGTEQEMANLRQGIRDMAKELPASTTEISAVAEAAGQLGIETASVEEFTRVMVDLGVTTNMTSNEAATALARLANITGMSADDYDRLGSTVVALGNDLATTEQEIVDMGLRLAGAGKQVGMSEAEILSLSGALSSVGIEAEAGGSAFSKVMVNMQLAAEKGGKDLENFADVAGMSAQDFKKAYQDDAAGALVAFIEGLSTAEERGMTAIGVLDEMGISEIRMRDSLLRAAGASDLFTDSIKLGSDAWDENIALTEEAEKRYGTTESKLKIMWNRIKDVGITLGESLVPAVMSAIDAAKPLIEQIESGAKAFSEMDEEQQRTILKMIAMVAAIGPASIALGGLTTATGGLFKVFGSVSTMLGTAKGAGLVARFGTLGMGGPVGLAIAGVTGLGYAMYHFSKEAKEARQVNLDTANSLIDQAKSVEELADKYGELRDKSNLTTDQIGELLDIQKQMESETDPEKIQSLADKYKELQEKSGLTNEEIDRLLDLNDEIIKQAPSVDQTFSDRGNAVIGSTEAVYDYIASLRNMAWEELQIERIKFLANEADLIKENTKLTQDRKAIEDLINLAIDAQMLSQEDLKTLLDQVNLKIDEGRALGEDTVALELERNVLLGIQKGEQVMVLTELQKQHDKIKDKLTLNDQEIRKLAEIDSAIASLLLLEIGINSEGKKGLDTANQELKKMREQKAELESRIKREGDKGGVMQREVETIDKQIGKHQAVINKILKATKEAKNLNRELAGDFQKTIRLNWTNTRMPNLNNTSGYKDLAYAEGTPASGHPGGPALVGEEGPELAKYNNKLSLLDYGVKNLPRGTQVFTHDQTKKILSGMRRVPAYASGVGVDQDLSNKIDGIGSNLASKQESVINNMSVSINATDVMLDGRKVGSITWKTIKENMDRNNFDNKRKPRGGR